MPSYQRPQRTIRAIECILNQNFEGFEAIIIGDCCPVINTIMAEFIEGDRFKEFISKGNNIRLVNLDKHYGGYGYQARNIGIQLSLGDYVIFLDNDDVLLPNHVENYYQAISNTENDLMFFNTIIHPIEVRGQKGQWVRESRLEQGKIGHAEIIVKSSILKNFPETSNYGHDWELIERMIKNGMNAEKSNNPPTYIVMGLGELRENID